MKQEALLKNWEFEWLNGAQCNILHGDVYGHPEFKDGQRIHTSKVLEVNQKYGIAETLHTFYKLEGYETNANTEAGKL